MSKRQRRKIKHEIKLSKPAKEKPPPELKGAEIGQWYRRKQQQRRNERNKQGIKFEQDSQGTDLNNVASTSGKIKLNKQQTSGIAKKRREKAKKAMKRHAKMEKRFVTERPVIILDKELEENINLLLNDFTQDVDINDNAWDIRRNPYRGHNVRNGLKNDFEFNNTMLRYMQDKQNNMIYRSMQEMRSSLPAFHVQQRLHQILSCNQVVVISGETGCGKTTQIAQFILDECIINNSASTCHIICTQPRRISAISVAERVSQERDEICGKSCGYQIRLESKSPAKRASILYCTTGILLQRLIGDPYLNCVSHLILDEIHEKDLLTDFMLIVAKKIMPARPDLKVILMSATLNSKIFSEFFDNCPVLDIPGFTYPVEEYFLEDIVETTNFKPVTNLSYSNERRYGNYMNEKKIEEQKKYLQYLMSSQVSKYYFETITTMKSLNFDDIDYDIVIHLIKYICHNLQHGAILIFMPGWEQISKLTSFLQEDSFFNPCSFHIIPLHSMISTDNQRMAFDRPPFGIRKIVISTNIAETSITIEDVVYVIDGGKSKEKTYDADSNISCLQPVWISKASAKQRRGRAGRVQPGKCFRLYTPYHYNQFQEYQLAEMLRTPLETICLQIKILQLGKIGEFLQKAIEPPSKKAVENAVHSLTQMRALDGNEELTSLGYHLAKLPLSPKVGRMILFGAIFSCLDPVLTIAASLEHKEPFIIPFQQESELFKKKLELATDSKSDHIMLLNAFKCWENAKLNGNGDQFCFENYLSSNTLRMIDNMKKQYAQHLHNIGFLSSSNHKDIDSNQQSGI